MLSPWVSRQMHDDMVRLLTTERDDWQALAKDMVAKYHVLATPVHPQPAPVVHQERAQPTIVERVITQQSQGDSRLGAWLSTYAAQLKQQGLSEDEIGMALTTWTTTEQSQ